MEKTDLKTFTQGTGKVIITDSVRDVNRALRRLNRFEGIKTCGCKVMSVVQIASELYRAYQATNTCDSECSYKIADGGVCRTIMQQLLLSEKIPAFIPKSSVSISSADEVLRIMNLVRENKINDAYNNEQNDRITGIKKLINDYENQLTSIGYIDKAILFNKSNEILKEENINCSAIQFMLPWMDGEIGLVDDIQLSEIEKEFLLFLEKKSGKVFSRIIISSIPMSVKSGGSENGCGCSLNRKYYFSKAFGSVNEIRNVVNIIKNKKYMFGDVAVVYAGDEYENVIREAFDIAGITYCFSKGFHVSEDAHISFMRELIAFAKDDYSYETLRMAVHNPAFKLSKASKSYRHILKHGIGWGKDRYISFFNDFDNQCSQDANKNEKNISEDIQFVEFLKKLINVFDINTGVGEVLRRLLKLADEYTTSDVRYKTSIREEIKNGIRALSCVKITGDVLLTLDDYLKNLRIGLKEEEGSVLIIPYGSREICDRTKLFTVGLGRENIERTVTESPVLSDEELHKYLIGDVDDAAGRNKRQRDYFERLLKGSPFDRVYVSYNVFNTVNMLKNSASKLYKSLLELYGNGTELDEVSQIGYENEKSGINLLPDVFYTAWDNILEDESTEIGDDDRVGAEDEDDSDSTAQQTPKATLSSTSLQDLLECPLKYHYSQHRYIAKEEQQKRNGHRWLPAYGKGNLFHHAAQDYINEALIMQSQYSLDEELLKKCFEKAAVEILKHHPSPSDYIMDYEKDEVYKVLKNYLNDLHDDLQKSSGNKKVLACEAEFNGVVYSQNIEFNGFVDRIDGEIVDVTVDETTGGVADCEKKDTSVNEVKGETACDRKGSILHLYIVDYKTGDLKKKEKEIEENKQIQHLIYAAGAAKWANEHKQEIVDRFGKNYSDIEISGMKYVFPFESGGAKEIDVTQSVFSVEPNVKKGILYLPDTAVQYLEECEELYLQGNPEFEKNIETRALAEIKKASSGKPKMDLCLFCNYKDICRIKLDMLKENKPD